MTNTYERDALYLDYIRSQACLVCGCSGVDPHHQPRRGHGATSLKVSDYRTVPLCRRCHDDYGQLSWELYRRRGIDVEAVIVLLNSGYFFA
jgi:hypothetical protein